MGTEWVEFQVDGRLLRAKRLCALDQWYLLRRVQRLIPALASVEFGSTGESSGALSRSLDLAQALAGCDDSDLDYLFDAASQCCQVRSDTLGSPAWSAMDRSATVEDLLSACSNFVLVNLGPLFTMPRNTWSPSSHRAPHYTPVSLPDGLDWLQRPVLRGMCSQEAVRGGVLHIEDFARMNDALDVVEENDYRSNPPKA